MHSGAQCEIADIRQLVRDDELVRNCTHIQHALNHVLTEGVAPLVSSIVSVIEQRSANSSTSTANDMKESSVKTDSGKLHQTIHSQSSRVVLCHPTFQIQYDPMRLTAKDSTHQGSTHMACIQWNVCMQMVYRAS